MLGSRRLRAAALAGLAELPCVVLAEDPEPASENAAHRQLPPRVLARLLQQTRDDPGSPKTWEQIAHLTRRTTRRIRQIKSLLTPSAAIVQLIDSGALTLDQLLALQPLARYPETHEGLAAEADIYTNRQLAARARAVAAAFRTLESLAATGPTSIPEGSRKAVAEACRSISGRRRACVPRHRGIGGTEG